MTEEAALKIAQRMHTELPRLIQPSESDRALAQLYEMYMLRHSIWFRIKQLFRPNQKPPLGPSINEKYKDLVE
jgi:hypothetical protein